jgi:hypothetical protein
MKWQKIDLKVVFGITNSMKKEFYGKAARDGKHMLLKGAANGNPSIHY